MITIRTEHYTNKDLDILLEGMKAMFNKQNMECNENCVDCEVKQSCKDLAHVIRYLSKKIIEKNS